MATSNGTTENKVSWLDVYSVPSARLRAPLARSLLRRAVAPLPVRIVHPDGGVIGSGGPKAPTLVLHTPDAFYQRIGSSGLVGLGESYQAGEWDSDDLPELLAVFAGNLDRIVPRRARRLGQLVTTRVPRQRTTRRRTLETTSHATTTCPTRCSQPSSTTR